MLEVHKVVISVVRRWWIITLREYPEREPWTGGPFMASGAMGESGHAKPAIEGS
jgi:hypothetical protein